MTSAYILIPVYKGLKETASCIDSVLDYSSDYPIVIINDASPDLRLTGLLRDLDKKHNNIKLIEHDQNLGFVKSVNEGFDIYPELDVIILNNDTVVTPKWADKLSRWACSEEYIATVTPFSNNATICSYPCICQPNTIPEQCTSTKLNAWFEQATSDIATRVFEVPTGIGFCMYIKRAYLKRIGYFNADLFGKGYGEENDFCLRCTEIAGRHVVAIDTFVYHQEGRSFGIQQKQNLTQKAIEILHGRFPNYGLDVQAFIETDSLWPIRRYVDVLRYISESKPAILLIDHGLGGGTSRHIEDLALLFFQKGWRAFKLEPKGRGVVFKAANQGEEFSILLDSYDWLYRMKEVIDYFNIQHLHFHHIQGYHPDIVSLPMVLGLSYDVTLHDYYCICPNPTGYIDRIHYYCGFNPDHGCSNCEILSEVAQKTLAPIDIAVWRKQHFAFLQKARKVIVPSQSAATIIHRFFPELPLQVMYHFEYGAVRKREPIDRIDNIIRVGIIGGISPQKGRRIIDECVTISRQQHLLIQWILIGSTDKESHRNEQDYSITGIYDRKDLPHLIDQYRIELVMIPALWPETYSYVLSECWLNECVVIVPEIGAFPERMTGVEAGYILPSPITADAIIQKIMHIYADPQDFFEKRNRTTNYKPVSSEKYWELIYAGLVEKLTQKINAKNNVLQSQLNYTIQRYINETHETYVRETAKKFRKELTLTHNHVRNLEAMIVNMRVDIETLQQQAKDRQNNAN
ncbi:MAG: glycosyltransferase [Desulfobacterales bacterium]|nr:glycosyltransferase [Desulfobacterales bacterium]